MVKTDNRTLQTGHFKQDTSQQDTSSQDTSQQDISQQDTSQQDISQQDTSNRTLHTQQDTSNRTLCNRTLRSRTLRHRTLRNRTLRSRTLRNRTLHSRTLRNRTLQTGHFTHNRTLCNRALYNRTLHNNATSTMTDAAMLLLLRRPLRNAVTFCAFEKPRERIALDNVHKPWHVFSTLFFRFEQFRHGTIHKKSTSDSSFRSENRARLHEFLSVLSTFIVRYECNTV